MKDDGYRCRECGEFVHPSSRTIDGSAHHYDGLLHWDHGNAKNPWYECGKIDNGLFRPGRDTRIWKRLQKRQAKKPHDRKWYVRDHLD